MIFSRQNWKQFFKKYDFSFLAITMAIFLVGILNLYSATHSSPSDTLNNLYKTQLMWYGVGILIAVSLSFIRPKHFFRWAYFSYGLLIFFLVIVLFLGKVGMGAQRWLALGPIRFQPSEFAKIAVILALSRWFSRYKPHLPIGIKEFIFPFFMAFFPCVLTILQPDLGTGLLIILIFGIMVFYRKLEAKIIIILSVIAVVAGLLMYNFGLREYQRKRIVNFINPEADIRGTGYNAVQSKIAIGSGKLFGKGFRKSSQGSLNYLPENHTDFVFAVFNEEHGFFGSLVLISLYLILFLRFIWLTQNATKVFHSLLSIGLLSLFFLHTIINMSMVMGLMPIVGIPLPLMSYGGSSLVTFSVCCGMATSISNSRTMFS
jgi:rod shape determining protein RodA